ncbi:MAG: PA0069 family radical SAM protein [Chitinophagales bacterium]|nr:PA0069 family radical SAM protein [Chitinophagales bacterium]
MKRTTLQSSERGVPEYLKGRGAQLKPANKYLRLEYVTDHVEALDEPLFSNPETKVFEEFPKKILNKVESPDLGMAFSMNPYQGCEHGCIYCYARNTHTYWGFNAGLDFESRIIVKPTAPDLLDKELRHKRHIAQPIMLSGNTDCYQPLERKLGITRRMLEVLLLHKHPVGIITKNSLILRDLDILSKMAALQLVSVTLSITTLKEDLRQLMEPRTATARRRLETIRALSANGIPVNVNVAPIIPAVNSDEIPVILEAAATAGALSAHYTMVRLNGDVAIVFTDWVHKNFPDRAEKILNQIRSLHGGRLNDSRFGTRMRGEGEIAESIRQLFTVARKKYFEGRVFPELDYSLFNNNPCKSQLSLF